MPLFRRLATALIAAAAAGVALPATATAYTPPSCSGRSVGEQELIVRYEEGTPAAEKAAVRREAGTEPGTALPGGSQTQDIADGESVRETIAELEARPEVDYAVPNFVARTSYVPNDPGISGRGLAATQWNFFGEFGIGAPAAWDHARRARLGGGKGVVVAVVDTGVAYQTRGRFRRAPDLYPYRWVRGYDFVDRDRYPNDENGHGTHVTGTIAQQTNNRVGVAGLAYGVKVMPLRVLDDCGEGDTASIARALTFAANNGAHVINLSLEFGADARAALLPDVNRALRLARQRGVTVVAASGNDDSGNGRVAYPAQSRYALAVGATTHTGCRAFYSNTGDKLDLVAPGGGGNADPQPNAWDIGHCTPTNGRFIYQQTFTRSVRSFGLPPDYEGTSMATPHVSATAALVIAKARKRGVRLTPSQVQARLQATARDAGAPGRDDDYGHGLLDAAAALAN